MFRRLRGGGRGGDDGRDEREDGDDRDRDGSGQMAPPPIAPPAIDTGPPMDMDAALEGLAGKQVRSLACRLLWLQPIGKTVRIAGAA